MEVTVIIGLVFLIDVVFGRILDLVQLSINFSHYLFVLMLFLFLYPNHFAIVLYQSILRYILVHMFSIRIQLLGPKSDNIELQVASQVIRHFPIDKELLRRLFLKPFEVILIQEGKLFVFWQ